jgi:hypothetical protein
VSGPPQYELSPPPPQEYGLPVSSPPEYVPPVSAPPQEYAPNLIFQPQTTADDALESSHQGWTIAAGFLALLVVLVLMGGFAYLVAREKSKSSTATQGPTRDTATISAAPSSAGPSSAAPVHPTGEATSATVVGLVRIDTSLADDPAAQGIARVLDRYFRGINQRNLTSAYGTLSPAYQAKFPFSEWSRGLGSSKDERIVVLSLTNDGAVRTAAVTFRSRQASGQGPQARPAETCTDWSLDFTLVAGSGDLPYLIDGSKSTTPSRPCS